MTAENISSGVFSLNYSHYKADVSRRLNYNQLWENFAALLKITKAYFSYSVVIQ